MIKENLVILAGWTRDKKSYRKLIDCAPSNWRVFFPSYRQLQPYRGISIFKENLLKFLEKYNLQTINLLGHSLGGSLAIHFAASFPDRLRHLFIVDAKGFYESESIFSTLRNMHQEHRKRTTAEHIEAFARTVRSPIMNLRLGLLVLYFDIRKEAPKIKMDTSIFWGERDHIAPLAHGKTLKSLIPNSKLYVLKGMGHDWIYDHPEHFWKNIVF